MVEGVRTRIAVGSSEPTGFERPSDEPATPADRSPGSPKSPGAGRRGRSTRRCTIAASAAKTTPIVADCAARTATLGSTVVAIARTIANDADPTSGNDG